MLAVDTFAATDTALATWLAPEPHTERVVMWHPGWGWGVRTRGVEHLTVLLSAASTSDFGGLCLDGDEAVRWAQAS